MPDSTQTYRRIAIDTPLGADVLLLTSADINEQLGRPFQIVARMVTERPTIDYSQVLGKSVTIRLDMADGTQRYWNGLVSHFSLSGSQGDMAQYTAVIVPQLWILSRTANFRVYQNQSVIDIVQRILQEAGVQFDMNVTQDYQPWETCVQFRETNLNFISRLMEQEGIYYYFKHENGRHRMIITDTVSGHSAYPGVSSIPYVATASEARAGECIFNWSVQRRMLPGAYGMSDYNFRNPRGDLKTSVHASGQDVDPTYEVFDFPGEYETRSEGEHYSRLRMEELRAEHETAEAATNSQGIATGYTFNLAEHTEDAQNKRYMVTAAAYHIGTSAFTSGAGSDGGAVYSCRFNAIDATVQFRSPRRTPKPIVHGPQTAVVVGPSGEEIYTDPDNYGRIRVRFHWDRWSSNADESSLWVRVAQMWAGRKWGSLFIPRVGMEVVVEFLDGDPDMPVITGCLYNGDNRPPYTLPMFKTLTVIKSDSTKGGGGANEIRFEDAKDDEHVFIHAERNLEVRVKNDVHETIDGQRHLLLTDSQFEKVQRDKHQRISGDLRIRVGGDQLVEVGGGQALKVSGGAYYRASSILIEADTQITLTAGGSSIVIDPSGVTLTGATVTLDASGMCRINSGPGSPPGSSAACSAASLDSAKDAVEAIQQDPGVNSSIEARQDEAHS